MSNQKKKQKKQQKETSSQEQHNYSEKDRAFAALEILSDMCAIRQGECTTCPIALKQTAEPMCMFEYVGMAPGKWTIKSFDELEPFIVDDFYDEMYMY